MNSTEVQLVQRPLDDLEKKCMHTWTNRMIAHETNFKNDISGTKIIKKTKKRKYIAPCTFALQNMECNVENQKFNH